MAALRRAHSTANLVLRATGSTTSRSVLPAAVNVGSRHLFSRAEPAYPGHWPLNTLENAFMAVGSGLMALKDPRRGDMVAALGETTAGYALPRMRDAMLASAEGRRILRERPSVNSDTVDMEWLKTLPEGTFGRAYISWLERCGVTPDTRAPVHYIDDPELAYVMKRYRESHDFYHCLCNLPVNVESELALKFFEFFNIGLPMTLLSGLLGQLRLTPEKRHRLFSEYLPWALKCGGGTSKPLISVYWEERWEQNVEDMKKELGVYDPPAAVWGRPLSEAAKARKKKLAAEKAAQERADLEAMGQIPRQPTP